MTDQELLVTRAKAGDPEAFGQLLSSLETRLYHAAIFLCGNREEARDLLQETFLGLYRGLPRFRGRSGIYTYAYRILLNLHHKRLRKKRRALVPLDRETASNRPSAAESFAREEKQEEVRKGIAALPPLFQEIVILRYLDQLSYQEIAAALVVNEGTVKSRLFKAKQLLRRILEKQRQPKNLR